MTLLAALLLLASALYMARCAGAARFFGDWRYELYAAFSGGLAIVLLGALLWSMAPT